MVLSSSQAAARRPMRTQGRWSTSPRILEAAVEVLYRAVRLRVVSRGLAVLDVEQAAQGGPQGGGELGPAV
jgi:hypothetical protein